MERNAIFAGLYRYVIRFRGEGGKNSRSSVVNRVTERSLKRVRRFAYCDRTCFTNGAIIYEMEKEERRKDLRCLCCNS